MTIIERAFQLAREGRCRSVTDIKRTLKAERFDGVDAHLSGSSIAQQLKTAMQKASAS